MSTEITTGFLEGSIAIATACILVFVYYWITASGRIRAWLNTLFEPAEAQIRKVLFSRLLGVLLFGIIPLIFLLTVFREILPDLGFGTGTLGRSLLLWLAAAILVISMAFFIARRKSNLVRYPQIRAGEWDFSLVILSALSWIAYLTGYEILFRGFLLFACYAAFGFWPAILINIIVYALAHIPKGKTETYGSIPVGLLFCMITLWQGSIWFALLAHITMALSNEWFSLYYHREMKVRPVRKRSAK